MAAHACLDRAAGTMSVVGMITSLSSPRNASVSISGLSKSPARVSTPRAAIFSGVGEMPTMFALPPTRALSSRTVAEPRWPLAPLTPMFIVSSPPVIDRVMPCCVGCADVLCALQEHVPVLCPRPRREVVEGHVRELAAERCAIDRVADTVEPLVHLCAVLAHALADDIQRDLEIGERTTGDTREDGDDVVTRELVARDVEALACEAAWFLKDANRDGPDVRDGDLRELSCRGERHGIDALRELLLAEIEVLHEKDGGQDSGAYADLRDVLFDRVLALEVRNARLAIGGADRGEDEMHACGLGRVRGGDALSRLGLRASFERRRHREERGRSFERLRELGRVCA